MQNKSASVYKKAIMGPTANLQKLHKHNRQQPLLPALYTGLAWGVTGVCLYQSLSHVYNSSNHALPFTIMQG